MIMTRDTTTATVANTAVLRFSWRFWALIAVVIAATAVLVTWTATQQHTDVGASSTAGQAAPALSIRQVEHDADARAALERLDDTDARRFANQASALAPVKSNVQQMKRLEYAELQRFRNRAASPAYQHPGVQP
jgi:predicted negative regulator of RcsB-dependent stress response